MKKIILVEKSNKKEAFTNFTDACKNYGLSYHYLKRKKMPFEYQGYKFYKLIIQR